MSFVPDVGDVVIVDFNPQAGKRSALVLSPQNFNKTTGFAWLCPITNQTKGYPFEVKVEGSKKTTGVILTDQMKSLDWSARNLHKVDTVNSDCLANVKSIVATILSI